MYVTACKRSDDAGNDRLGTRPGKRETATATAIHSDRKNGKRDWDAGGPTDVEEKNRDSMTAVCGAVDTAKTEPVGRARVGRERVVSA